MPRSRARFILLSGNRMHTNYGISNSCKGQHRQTLSRLRHPWRRDGETEAFTRWAAHSEVYAIWGRHDILTIEHHGGRAVRALRVARPFFTDDIKVSAGKAFAALFFIRASTPRLIDKQLPLGLELEVACRLPTGEHLHAIMHTLLDREVQLYWSLPSGVARIRMCDRQSWVKAAKLDKPLTWGLRIEAQSCNTQIQVHMDNIYAPEQTEEVGNSPRTLQDLIAETYDHYKDGDGVPRLEPHTPSEVEAVPTSENVSSGPKRGTLDVKEVSRPFEHSSEEQQSAREEQSVITEFELDTNIASSSACTQFTGIDSELEELGTELKGILNGWK